MSVIKGEVVCEVGFVITSKVYRGVMQMLLLRYEGAPFGVASCWVELQV